MSNVLLIQPKPGAAHVEIVVHIDWDEISPEDIKFLASQLLIHNLEAKIKSGFYGSMIPQVFTINAAWEVHRHQVEPKDYCIPESWKSGLDKPEKVVEKKAKPSLEELLAALSPAERAALLA